MKTEARDEFIRKRMERQRRIRKRRLITFFIFFIIFLICVGIALSLTIFFPIEKISVTGSKIYTAQQIENVSGIDVGDNLFALSEKAVLKKIKRKLPYIECVKLKRELPSSLSIEVSDAKEFACFYVGDKYYTVSKSGWVLNETETPPENLFLISGATVKCSVGNEMIFSNQEEKVRIDEITTTLTEEKLKTDYIDISSNVSLKLGVEGRFDVELGTANDLHEKIRHLSSMIEKIDTSKRGKINLSMWTNTNPKGTFVEENLQ